MTIEGRSGYTPSYLEKAERKPRENGLYAKTKIEAFIRYCKAAEMVFKGQKAIGNIGHIIHFEPFCGPGWNQTKDGSNTFAGTPLRAVQELKQYDTFIFNDYDKGIMDCLFSELIDLGFAENHEVHVVLTVQDANQAVQELESFLPKRTGRTNRFFGTAIVDPEDLWFSWESTTLLAKKRLDLLAMIPSHIDLARNIKNPGAVDYVTKWLGEPKPSEDLMEVLARYEEKLKTLYKWVHGVSTSPLPENDYIWVPGKYHLIAASHCSNDVASKIWTGEVLRTVKKTRGMPLFDDFDV